MTPAHRVVVKIGTNTVTGELGYPDPEFLAEIAKQVKALRETGHEVIIVSSGAIGAGKAALGITTRVRDVKLRQACAALGQSRLMAAWQAAFTPHGVEVAQILLTYSVFSNRKSYLHARDALLTLLGLGVVPVINENDAIAIDEIDATFGDNDKLAGLVAAKMEARTLVVLSDVPGLFDKPPAGDPSARLIPVVTEITPDIIAAARGPGSAGGSGGMHTKLVCAQIATESGIEMVIARGRDPDILVRIFAGDVIGTRFIPRERVETKKKWLEYAAPRGRVIVDDGAALAMRNGKHLLPAGVTAVEGNFEVESLVEIVHGDAVLGKAVSRLSSDDLRRVKGCRSEEAARLLELDGSVNVTRKGGLVLLA